MRRRDVQRRNQVTQLEEKNAKAERVAADAVDTAERAQKECLKLREEKDVMQARLDKAEEEARERTQSINRLQDLVNSHKRRVGLPFLA